MKAPEGFIMRDGGIIELKPELCYPGTKIEMRPSEKTPKKYSVYLINLETNQDSRFERKDGFKGIRYEWAISTALEKIERFKHADWWLLKVGIMKRDEIPERFLDERYSDINDIIDRAERYH